MESRIHIVYREMSKLLTSLMSKFIKSKLLRRDDSNNAKSVSDLLTFNVKDTKNFKPLKLIDIGTKAKCLLPESLDITSTEKKFRHNCVEAYQAFVSHLRLKLPWESTILRNAIFLDPAKKGDKMSLNAITNLTKEVCKPLEVVLRKIFPTCSTTDEVCDQTRNECKMCQIHVLTETSYSNEANETTQGRCQILYWENAFELAGLPFNSDSKCKVDIYTLIVSLEKKIVDDAGSPKFPSIASLFKIVSSFSHGNSAPENGFSINKYLIQLHGTAFNSDTIEALRFVKDTILSYGGILNMQITKSLLQSAKLAYSRYEAELAAKQRLLEQTSKVEKQKEIKGTKRRETEDERNTTIASVQQVRIDKIPLNIYFFF